MVPAEVAENLALKEALGVRGYPHLFLYERAPEPVAGGQSGGEGGEAGTAHFAERTSGQMEKLLADGALATPDKVLQLLESLAEVHERRKEEL